MSEPNLIEEYLDFFSGTEPPTIFNRWAIIGGIGALLGRQCWFQHGHKKVYPNQYIMLVGESGTRKSTALKIFLKPLLEEIGYKSIAANKTSKEKFLLDFEEGFDITKMGDRDERFDVSKTSKKGGRAAIGNPTMRELFGIKNTTEPSECLVLSDDLNVFLGHSNIEFIELLTDLWDYEGIYSSRIKSGHSPIIPNPTLSCLLGNTQIGISLAFPTEVIGQGFFSRIISVFSEPSGRRITFPPPPDPEKRKQLLELLTQLRGEIRGQFSIEPMAYAALDDIYQHWKDIDDIRFRSYSTRRFDHLLKLCMCCSAARLKRTIDSRIVEYANSILHYTESFMPKALGEFGKARNSDVQAKILELCEKSIDKGGLSLMEEIWPQVSRDLDSTTELVRIISGMKEAGKLQQVGSTGKFLPNKKQILFDQPHCKVGLLREYIEDKVKKGEPI